MRITKGLIIADPWIGYILDGKKDWEMRSAGASHRGWFGLVRKGTGAIYGVAKLVKVGTPLSPSQMIATWEHHRIPEHMIRSGEVAKWNTPWVLADVHQLDRPVPYRHKSGAVTWVELDDAATNEIACQFEVGLPTTDPAIVMPVVNAARQDQVGSANEIDVGGSQFGRNLLIEGELDYGKLDVAAPAGVTLRLPNQAAGPLTLKAAAATRTTAGRVIGEVVITEGNIANNHIYLRSFFDCFPTDAIGGSNKAKRAKRDLTVEWGGAEAIQTDLDGEKKFFRARGWIGAFYKLHQARAGDCVLIEEIAAYRYRVSLKKSGTQREGV